MSHQPKTQKTAVEVLFMKLKPANWTEEFYRKHFKEIFEEAQELFKYQIADARQDGHNSTYAEYGETPKCYLDGTNENYITETYGE